MKVHALFGEMSELVDQINAVRDGADASAREAAGRTTRSRKQLAALSRQADEIRKKIVATKEGGAITGEERLREHIDTLYGAIMSYDGKPARLPARAHRRAEPRARRRAEGVSARSRPPTCARWTRPSRSAACSRSPRRPRRPGQPERRRTECSRSCHHRSRCSTSRWRVLAGRRRVFESSLTETPRCSAVGRRQRAPQPRRLANASAMRCGALGRAYIRSMYARTFGSVQQMHHARHVERVCRDEVRDGHVLTDQHRALP